MKHYAYHNMSRRTQLTTKFTFSVMAQLSENFIFIYLGLSLFTDPGVEYKPLFILVTVIGIGVARWCAVFPLSSLINWFIRYRARRRGQEAAEEIPSNWKMMIFWSGLRGAVGVALAAGLKGKTESALRATVLVVVVLSVIIFGGTTSRMLEILHIRTGVVEEIDSDDEFDIEPVRNGAPYSRRNGKGFGHHPKHSGNGAIGLDSFGRSGYSPGSNGSPVMPPDLDRRQSSRDRRDLQNSIERGLLGQGDDFGRANSDDDDLDLPPAARRSSQRSDLDSAQYPVSGSRRDEASQATGGGLTARGAINQILNATSEDAGTLFAKLDENFLKPHLLLDPGGSSKS